MVEAPYLHFQCAYNCCITLRCLTATGGGGWWYAVKHQDYLLELASYERVGYALYFT